MACFLERPKNKKAFEEKLSNNKATTNETIATGLKSFEKFCKKTWKRSKDKVIDELLQLKKSKDHGVMWKSMKIYRRKRNEL